MQGEEAAPLRVRIPGWAADPTISRGAEAPTISFDGTPEIDRGRGPDF